MQTRPALTSRTSGRRPLGGFLSSPPRCECLLGFRWAFAGEVWVIFGDPGGFGVPLWIRGGREGLRQTAGNFRTSLTLRGANSFLRFAAGDTACSPKLKKHTPAKGFNGHGLGNVALEVVSRYGDGSQYNGPLCFLGDQ